MKNILALIFFLNVWQNAFAEENTSQPVAWLGFGDLRGYVEPCGCDAATDMGGVQRLYYAIQQERLVRPDLWVFNLGNLQEPKTFDPLKEQSFQEFHTLLKPTASLVNALEFRDYFLDKRVSAPASGNFVLSNYRKTLPGNVKKSHGQGFLIVFGYLSPKLMDAKQKNSDLIGVDAALLKNWGQELSKASEQHRVLLFSGSEQDLKQFAASNLFDEIILANLSPFSVQVDAKERLEPNLLHVKVGKKVFLQVPIGGQGLLRGGDLLKARADSLSNLLGLKKEAPTPLSSGSTPFISPFDWLDLKWQSMGPKIKPLQTYQEGRAKEYAERTTKLLAEAATSSYIGAETCKTCHSQAYETWKSSKHAQAFAVLEEKKADQNAECVTCHSVGFDKKGGFIDKTHTPQLMGVGCEQCHGPRRAHAENPAAHKAPIADKKALCVSCHHPPHSTTFSFEAFWPKIKHGKDVP